MRATRADVARLAGVSTATVSNVLNNAHKVKPKTRERVLEAIEALRYRPDMVARGLITGQTRQIGIVLDDIRNPYYGEIVEHFEAVSQANGYFVNICTGIARLDRYFDDFVTRGLDGVFVAALPYKFDTAKLYDLTDSDIQVVVSGSLDIDTNRLSSIRHDYRKGMRAAFGHLVSLGHTDIAYLSGLGRQLSYDERCVGYLQCLRDYALSCGDSLLVDGAHPFPTNTRQGYRLANELLERGRPFTAVICGNDLMAIGAIRAFAEKGLAVPGDVSVLGFDGIEIGRYCPVSLTTLAVDSKAYGEAAFTLLHRSMTDGTYGTFTNELTLVPGESTAPRGR